MKIIDRLKRKWRYRNTWRTPIGQDCISLDTSLCKWLGDRLVFMSEHANSFDPAYTYERWCELLRTNGEALLAWHRHWDLDTLEEEQQAHLGAQEALRWVADNLGTLWD